MARVVSARVSGSNWALGALLIALSAGVGGLAARSQLLAIGVAGIAGVICLLTLGRRLTTLFLVLSTTLLTGYAFFDKAFAYIGVFPLFVSEAVLAVAVLHLVVSYSRLRLTWLHVLLIAFMAWGLARTVPYIGEDGINALRDGTLWGYGLFALAFSAAISAKHFERIRSLYNWSILPFLFWTPLAVVIGRVYGDQIPAVFGSNVSALSLKAGDVGVQLGGIGAFVFAGLHRGFLTRRAVLVLLLTLWLVGVAVVGSANRGAFLAATSGLSVLLLLRPSWRLVTSFIAAVVLAAGIVVSLPEVNVASQRTLSLGQIADNVMSIVVDTGSSQLEGSVEWRTAWWNTIIAYTLDGPYFWTGKGFGVNLADDDGFQVDSFGTLRSPHSAHLNVLARMGVPGLALWLLLQAGFGASMLRSYFRARRHGATLWCQIDVWLLAFWLAMIVNASVDVFFEGPQGGIWFWSIFGLGLAAIGIQKSAFEEMDRAAAPAGLSVASLARNVRGEALAAAPARGTAD